MNFSKTGLKRVVEANAFSENEGKRIDTKDRALIFFKFPNYMTILI